MAVTFGSLTARPAPAGHLDLRTSTVAMVNELTYLLFAQDPRRHFMHTDSHNGNEMMHDKDQLLSA